MKIYILTYGLYIKCIPNTKCFTDRQCFHHMNIFFLFLLPYKVDPNEGEHERRERSCDSENELLWVFSFLTE